MNDYEISVPLPEGSQVTCAVVAVQFIDREGNMRTAVGTKGESTMTTLLGLTVIAQEKIKELEEMGGEPEHGASG